MNKLSEFTDYQLTKELEDRQNAFFFKPKKVVSPDFSLLMKLVDTVMENANILKPPNKDVIFEAAIAASYGKEGLRWYLLRKENAVKTLARKLFNR